MANDFEHRLGRLEGDFSILREYIPILYGYLDEVRANSRKLDRQHDEMVQRQEDMLKRIEQNEWMIASLVDTQRSMIETQDRMMLTQDTLVETQGKIMDTVGRIVRTQDTLVETQGMMLQLMDRMDRKLDDLGKPGKNGHS